MGRPFATPVTTALPDVRLAGPRVRPAVLALARALSGAYLRLGLGYRSVRVLGAERLVRAFDESLSGAARCVLAFRHPYGDEAQLMSWLFLRGVPREARRLGVRLPARPWAIFVHGYEVPRWSGPLVRWLLPRMGALPVHHSKMDSAGMARIRAALEDGPLPLALAPEGQVSYASDRVPRLEQGAARLALGAAASLAARGRGVPVRILPISVHHRHGPESRPSLLRLVRRIERLAGLGAGRGGQPIAERLLSARDAMLDLAERHYGMALPAEARPEGRLPEAGARLEALIGKALEAGERILGLPAGRSDPIERVYRIRQAGWDRIFVPGAGKAGGPPLERALADRRAGEAWYAMRHMEFVDFAWYFASGAPDGELSRMQFSSLVEYAQNLWDLGNRLSGGAISGRLTVRPRRALVIVADPIDADAASRESGTDRRAAVAALTADLDSAYRRCIEESLREHE